MKTLKKILLVVLILAALFVVIAFFLPQKVHVERSANIDAPAKIIFNQVNDLHNWDKWAVWNQIDPEMTVEYINNGIGENSGYTWTSDNSQVGSGKLMINASVPYDSIFTTMDFMEEGSATGYFLFNETDTATMVTWAFDTDLGFNPVARWMGLMFDAMIGKDFEQGLDNLGVVSETIAEEKQPVVEIVELPSSIYISMRETIKWGDIEMKMSMMYGALSKLIEKENLMMTNAPFAIYHKIDGENIDIEIGIPVNRVPENLGDNIMAGELKDGKYVHADHFGSYEELEKTHSFIQNWMEKRKFIMTGSPMEQYLTDPMQEPDTTKWITAIYYPI